MVISLSLILVCYCFFARVTLVARFALVKLLCVLGVFACITSSRQSFAMLLIVNSKWAMTGVDCKAFIIFPTSCQCGHSAIVIDIQVTAAHLYLPVDDVPLCVIRQVFGFVHR